MESIRMGRGRRRKVRFWMIRDGINGQVWTEEGWQESGGGSAVVSYGSEEEAELARQMDANVLGAEVVECVGEEAD